jgi:hypothetical protein
VSDIGAWWPHLDEQIRRWIVNNFGSPVAPYTISEIEHAGGPSANDVYWERRDGEFYLPGDAVQWILKSTDFERLAIPKKPDPRAAYFKRGWPRRQD